jgi:hypothetical protein
VLRRALPWAAAAGVIIFAGALLAVRQLHPGERRPATGMRDTTPVHLAVVQQATPALPLAAAPGTGIARNTTPPLATTASTTEQSAVKKPHHVASEPAPKVKKTRPAPKPAVDTTSRSVPQDRTAAAAREIRSHIERMKTRFDSGDMRGARQELGEAAGMLSIVRDLDPDPAQVMELQRELAQGVRALIADCYRMRADSTLPRGVRCENLTPAANRFRKYRGAQ